MAAAPAAGGDRVALPQPDQFVYRRQTALGVSLVATGVLLLLSVPDGGVGHSLGAVLRPTMPRLLPVGPVARRSPLWTAPGGPTAEPGADPGAPPPPAAEARAPLPAQVASMVKAFGGAQNPKLKYQQLLFLAKALPPLPASDHTVDNRVLGCTAQVWVTARYVDGRMVFAADSDSELTKGLAALLIKCLSGLTPQEVLLLDSSFLARFGMQGSVTPSRINGFLNMFRTMQRKTLEAVRDAEP